MMCQTCGVEFMRCVTYGQPQRPVRYCSRACVRNGAGRPRANGPACKVYFPTCRCGLLFSARSSARVWCSVRCKYLSQAYPPEQRTCKMCRSVFAKVRGNYRRDLCSRQCQRKWSRRHRSVEEKRCGRDRQHLTSVLPSGVSMASLPPAYIETVKAYRQLNQELWRFYNGKAQIQ